MSLHFEVYYVRTASIPPDRDFIYANRLLRVLGLEAGEFFLAKQNNDSPDINDNNCRHYSGMVGECIYIGIQDNVGLFHYEHWKEGVLQRILSYNSDYSWHHVEGKPEQWEREILFSEDRLNDAISCYDEEMHGVIRAAWEARQIHEGDQFPAIFEMDAYGGLVSLIEKNQLRF